MGDKIKHTYIIDHTNNLIHYYRCSKVGENFERFDADNYTKVSKNYSIKTCETCNKMSGVSMNKLIVPIIQSMIMMVVLAKIKKINDVSEYKLWIESPNGFKKQVKFYQALRIIRKHDWKLAEVEPIKPELTKLQMIKKIVGLRV